MRLSGLSHPQVLPKSPAALRTCPNVHLLVFKLTDLRDKQRLQHTFFSPVNGAETFEQGK